MPLCGKVAILAKILSEKHAGEKVEKKSEQVTRIDTRSKKAYRVNRQAASKIFR